MKFFGKPFSSKLLWSGALVSFVYLFSTPYLSILSFKRALDNKDSIQASKYIDFYSVRNSLKEQMMTSLRDEFASDNSANSFINIVGSRLLDPLAENIIKATLDNTVTANGLALLLSTGKLSKGDPKEIHSIRNRQFSKEDVNIKLHYIDINRFVLISYLPQFRKPIKAYWHRENILHWNLNSIQLPPKFVPSF